MPFSGGTAGAHDDAMHQGNAKRDVADGLAGLGPLGELLAPGSDLVLTRDGSENIELIERTSGEIVARWTRIGVDDYEFFFLIEKKVAKSMNVERAISLLE